MKPTFLEMLIVIVIIGILAAITIPKFRRTSSIAASQMNIGESGVRRVDDTERGVVCYTYGSSISCLQTP